MAPEVLHGLLQRVPNGRPAMLHGFSRYKVKDYDFPAILKNTPESTNAAAVDGLLLDDLSPRELRALDYYEDEAYERLEVEVVLAAQEGGETKVGATAYVWPRALDHLVEVGTAWHYDTWHSAKCSAFVKEVVIPCSQSFAAEEAELEAESKRQ